MDASQAKEEVNQLADLWLAAIVAGALLVYLVYALMKPEEF
ncbi:K(+)-transporting ATPase subunit F [bacterium BFN5]|nr:K(+)-transporting ATPase subunit F [bacterium BFN5]